MSEPFAPAMQGTRRAVLLALALVALGAVPRRASAQYIDVEIMRVGGVVQWTDLGSRTLALDAVTPGSGPVHATQLGSAIGLSSYVLGGGSVDMSIAVRRWHLGLAFGGAFGGGGQTSGQLAGYYFGQTLSVSSGYVEPQAVGRIRMGGAGDLELRAGLRVGGFSMSIPVVGPTTACPLSCGGASVHYDDMFLMPHVRIDWLGGSYDSRSSLQMELGIGLDFGVSVYPALGYMAGVSFTFRMPITAA